MTARGGRSLLIPGKAFATLLVALLLAVGVLVGGREASAWADDAETANASATNEGQAMESEASQESGRVDISLDEDLNSIKENQLPDSSFIYDTSIVDLANADTYYDQQTVQVVGEAVGDIVNDSLDPDYCWVVLWDDGSTVTLNMKHADAELIDTLGSYSAKGTMLQVRGVFNLVCSEHEGASDLHVTSVTVTSKGAAVDRGVEAENFLPGAFLVVVGLLLLLVFRRLREKQR